MKEAPTKTFDELTDRQIEMLAETNGLPMDILKAGMQAMAQAGAVFDMSAIEGVVSPPGECEDVDPSFEPGLEAARIKHSIPDMCFRERALFDRIHLFQIAESTEEPVESRIMLPGRSAARTLQESPRYILVSMGLEALSIAASHDIRLGDEILGIRHAPYFITVGRVAGREVKLTIANIGDLVSNKSQQERVRRGETVIGYRPHPGNPNSIECLVTKRVDPKMTRAFEAPKEQLALSPETVFIGEDV